jgi:hypothetical protein
VSALGTSFWRQDVKWYVSQQGWTRSFHQVDQNWNRELSGGTSAAPTTTPAQTGESGSASIVNPDALSTGAESGWTSALQSSLGSSSDSAPTTDKSGSLLNLII